MWTLNDYKRVFYAVGLVGVIGCSIPSLMAFVRLPSGERFSELYVLGPGRMAEGYPFNVSAGESYRVYLGVGNHMGGSMFYVVYLKFRNSSESLPNVTSSSASSLPVLYEYRVFLRDESSWEGVLDFSFSGVVFDGNNSFVGKVGLDDVLAEVNKTAVWDSERSGFYYQVFAELWIYDATNDSFNFHNRFVSLWFNMTYYV